jgi:hypothetical protein
MTSTTRDILTRTIAKTDLLEIYINRHYAHGYTRARVVEIVTEIRAAVFQALDEHDAHAAFPQSISMN